MSDGWTGQSPHGQPQPDMPAPRPAVTHPGWLARSLFWAAIIIGALPALIVVPLIATGDPRLIGAVQAVISTVFWALVFISWNVARNRGWRVLLASVIFVITVSGVETMAQAVLSIVRSLSVVSSVLIQVMSLALTFLGLGLFHLLGKLRSASVPPQPNPYGQWDPSPQNPYSQPQTPPHYGGPRR